MSTPKVPPGDAIRALIEQVDAICAQSAHTSREIDARMKRRSPFMPERRDPKHWQELPNHAGSKPPRDDP